MATHEQQHLDRALEAFERCRAAASADGAA